MDSGNTSGSIQSSSGDDQEHDSRGETSISAFLINSTSNNPSSSHVGPLGNPPPPSQQHHSSSSSMFDPLSNYFDNPLSRSPHLTNPNSILNLDLVWSKNLRSDPNCTDLGGFMATSSPTQQFLTNQAQSTRPTFGSLQFPQGPENNATKGSVSVTGSVPGTIDQTNTNNNNMGVRNPKKRSRASRRAPTTVLTTDTTNFRAMVQEFTGIPAPPFTSSPFPRSRLDLFGTSSTLRSAATHLDPSPPPYLLRPFAQKIHPPTPTAFVSSSSSFPTSSFVDAIASSTTTNITSGTNSNIISTTSSNSTSINYPLPQNLLNINMQNPVFNFQSILQAPPNKYPILGTKPQGSLDISSNDSHLKVGVLEEFGLSHGHVTTNLGGLQNIVSSQETTLPRSDSNPSNWAGGGLGSNEGDHQSLLRSINGSYNNSQRVTNGKVNNFSASSSDFHGDKGPENVATRGEGMVESWICSSD